MERHPGYGVLIEDVGSGCGYYLDSRDVHALFCLTALSHLSLEHVTFHEQEVWAALPTSLQSLELRAPRSTPPPAVVLPNLRHLVLHYSRCSALKRLLAASSKLQTVYVSKLWTPATIDEQSDLRYIMRHPIWCNNDGGDPSCTPVTHMHMFVDDWEWYQGSELSEEARLFPREVLAALPALPTVLNFMYDFHHDPPAPADIEGSCQLLCYIPRVCPNLQVLRLDSISHADSDLTPLRACPSLRKLEFRCCQHITEKAVLQLARALPDLDLVFSEDLSRGMYAESQGCLEPTVERASCSKRS